ncbi:MAG: hypothetical protein ACHRXM_35015 [Isosphaerales bacterium]
MLTTPPALAARAAREAGLNRGDCIDRIARIAFGREADPVERRIMSEFLAGDDSLYHLCLAMLNTNAFIYVD